MTSGTVATLDRHYAEQLGCTPKDLNSGRLVVIGNDQVGAIRFAKGVPLVLFSIAKGGGAVISVESRLKGKVEEVIREAGASSLDDDVCDAIERAIGPSVDQPLWFRGRRLYCEPAGFVDQKEGIVRNVTHDDPHAGELHARWGGQVFGQVAGGLVVSWAAIKPLSDVVWDLSVETLPDHRGRGCAKSAVSAAVKFIFANGRLAAWGTDRTNIASLATARAVGFVDYGLDFGCVGKVVES